MQSIKFVTNDLTVKNNKGLKNRGQFCVEMEVERQQLNMVMPLEEYQEGTHFLVTITPYDPNAVPFADNQGDGELPNN